MTIMGRDLSEALSLHLTEGPLSGRSPLPNPIRPTLSGLNWLAAPTQLSGIAYRVSGTTLEGITVNTNGTKVVTNTDVGINVVHMATSYDGRLIVVACLDGSLRCYNSTPSSLQHRWTIPDAHSHVTQNVSSSPSQSRAHGAGKSGPVRSLSFSPTSYVLLLADAGRERLSMYNAAESQPTNFLRGQLQDVSVSSAAWSSSIQTSTGDVQRCAVGDNDGCIHILQCTLANYSMKRLAQSSFPRDEDGEGWSCTHLDWINGGLNLVAGFCRVSEEGEDDDGDDEAEDDTASHETVLFIASVDSQTVMLSDWVELGDVVPFFSAPKHGRHVYFTSHVSVADATTNMLVVASNFGSDLAIVSQTKEHTWEITDLEEGSAATMPTNEDDEYTFPVGIATITAPLKDGAMYGLHLLVAATDGSLSVFRFNHSSDASFFAVGSASSGVQGIAGLPDVAVEVLEVAVDDAPPDLADEPVKDASGAAPTLQAAPPTSAAPIFGSGTGSGFKFWASGTPPTLGSAAAQTKPLFGSGAGFASSGLFSPAPPAADVKAQVTGSLLAPSTFGVSVSASPFSFPKTESTTSGSSSAPSFSIFGPKSTDAADVGLVPLEVGKPTVLGSVFDDKSSPVKTDSSPPDERQARDQAASVPVSQQPVAEAPPPVTSESASKLISESPEAYALSPADKDESAPVLTEMGEKAAEVFDSFDEARSGTLPIEMFESLIDAVGEGLSADAFDEEISAVDQDGSGVISRSTFIKWYVNFTKENSEDDDQESLDSEDLAEREAERQKASSSFALLAEGKGESAKIRSADFEKLLDSLGTSFSAKECARTIRNIQDEDGKIGLKPFLDWYIQWLFKGYEDGEEDESAEDDEEREPASDGSAPATSGWGTIFAVDNTWRCENCFSRNSNDLTACPACESPQPGAVGATPAISGASAGSTELGSTGSTGASGFSFGFNAPSSGSADAGTSTLAAATVSSGFTFGFASTTTAGTGPTNPAVVSGFSFGTTGSVATSAPISSIGSGGFSYGSTRVPESLAEKGGLSFGLGSSSATTDDVTSVEPTSVISNPASTKDSAVTSSFGATTVRTEASSSETRLPTTTQPAMSKGAGCPPSGGAPGATAQFSTSSDSVPSSSGYPPLSLNGPTSVGEGAQVTTTSTRAEASSAPSSLATGRGYPPISLKAPTPFSGGAQASASAPVTTKASPGPVAAGNGYPPISSKAPKPFSGGAQSGASATAPTKPTPATIESGYSPISSKAPKPFSGGAQSSAATPVPTKPTSAAAGNGYPPISVTAPTAFSGGTQASASAPGTTQPATKAIGGIHPPFQVSTPFGGGTQAEAPVGKTEGTHAPVVAGCSYPPLALKAPTPFSGVAAQSMTTPVTLTKGGGYPPMSSNAPTPFSRSTQAKTQSTTTSPATSAGDGYPPMPFKAPTPFGGGTQAPTSKDKKASATTTPTTAGLAASLGAYPPISLKAPTPFSAGAKATASSGQHASLLKVQGTAPPTKQADSVNAEPKLFDSVVTAPTTSWLSPHNFQGSSTFSTSTSGTKLNKVSGATLNAVNRNDASDKREGCVDPASMSGLKNSSLFNPSPVAHPTSNIGNNLKHERDRLKSSQPPSFSSGYEEQLALVTEKFNATLQKLAEKTPNPETGVSQSFEVSLERLHSETRRLSSACSDVNTRLSALSHRRIALDSQVMDSRRQISEIRQLLNAHNLDSWERKTLFEEQPLDAASESRRRELAAAAKAVYNCLKRTESRLGLLERLVSPNDNDSRMALAHSLTSTHEELKRFERTSTKLDQRLAQASYALHLPLTSGTVQDREWSQRQLTHKKLLPIALPSDHTVTTLQIVPCSQGTNWKKIEMSLSSARSQNKAVRRITRAPRSFISFSGPKEAFSRSKEKTTISEASTPWSSSQNEVHEPLFTPPSAAKVRSSWNDITSVDRQRVRNLTFSLPQQLKTVTVDSIARDALGVYGTTPEKVNENFSFRKRESTDQTSNSASPFYSPDFNLASKVDDEGKVRKSRGTPADLLSSRTPTASTMSTTAVRENSNATRQLDAKAAPTRPSSYPPLSTQPPKTFSSATTASERSTPSSAEGTNKRASNEAEVKSTPVPTFGNLQSLTDSLFETTKETQNERENPVLATSHKVQPYPPEGSAPDYRKLLTSFYEQHNPSRLGEVEQSLTKYKGKETAMFEKLANKYKVENPLKQNASSSGQISTPGLFGNTPDNSTNTTMASFGTPSSFQQSASAAPSSNAFASMSTPSTTQSPFGAALSAPSPSPFGAASSSSATSPSFFGVASSAPSPFSSPPVPSFGQPSFPVAQTFAQPAMTGQPSPGPAPTQVTFAGRSPRDLLVAFYQQHNAAKIAEVDKLLEKYKGNEEQMFRNLAKKYSLDPSIFGLQATPVASHPTPPQNTGFGQLSALGGGSAFGTSSGPLGSPLRTSMGGGFGQTSSLGSGFSQALPPSGHVFGASSSPGFGTASFGALASFGSPPTAPSGFVSPAAPSGFGSPAASSGFGSPPGGFNTFGSPFGAPRR